MSKHHDRQRCLTVGCNPLLIGERAADSHREATGHRTAEWPVRSAEGARRARIRNKTGYYDKYNVGAKSASARGIGRGIDLAPSEPSPALGWGDYYRRREERDADHLEEYGITEYDDFMDTEYHEYLWNQR